jgi:hypothetical protein
MRRAAGRAAEVKHATYDVWSRGPLSPSLSPPRVSISLLSGFLHSRGRMNPEFASQFSYTDHVSCFIVSLQQHEIIQNSLHHCGGMVI